MSGGFVSQREKNYEKGTFEKIRTKERSSSIGRYHEEKFSSGGKSYNRMTGSC